MPTQGWNIQIFVTTYAGMVFTKIITIILGIGISMVGCANAQKNHKTFCKYQTCNGIESTSHD
jgi:hypothetical protein